MKVFAKLLAFLVGCIFVSAVWFTVAGSLESGESEEVTETISEVDYEEIKYTNVQLPPEFMISAQNNLNIKTVRPLSLEEFKKVIYLEPKVLVLIDNAKLKNPFLGVLDKVLVQPVGFNATHIMTTGREVGQESFKYVSEEFWAAVVDSGRKIWVINS
jgi:hypothetical protein